MTKHVRTCKTMQEHDGDGDHDDDDDDDDFGNDDHQ